MSRSTIPAIRRRSSRTFRRLRTDGERPARRRTSRDEEFREFVVDDVRYVLGHVMTAVHGFTVFEVFGELLPDVEKLLRAGGRLPARAPQHDRGHLDLPILVGGVHLEIACRRRTIIAA